MDWFQAFLVGFIIGKALKIVIVLFVIVVIALVGNNAQRTKNKKRAKKARKTKVHNKSHGKPSGAWDRWPLDQEANIPGWAQNLPSITQGTPQDAPRRNRRLRTDQTTRNTQHTGDNAIQIASGSGFNVGSSVSGGGDAFGRSVSINGKRYGTQGGVSTNKADSVSVDVRGNVEIIHDYALGSHMVIVCASNIDCRNTNGKMMVRSKGSVQIYMGRSVQFAGGKCGRDMTERYE